MLVPRQRLAEAEELAQATRRGLHARRPVRRLDPPRPARLRRPARARPRLHREGRRGGREADHRRRRAARGPRARLLRPPHRLLRGDAGDDDRPGGDLRPGAGDPALRGRGRRRPHRQLDRVRPRRRRLVGATRSARSRVAKRIRTGQIEINGGAFNPLAPFGGYGQSGHGRENGRYGIEELLQVKSLQL